MLTKILVVDDEPQFERLLRQRFRRKIRNQEYELVFANNGIEALEILEQNPAFDIVLSDINMPKMDGLTFLSRLKENMPQIRTVIVSAYGDMSNIRAAMNLGAYDFVTKPINFEDLETTIEKTLEEVELTRRAALAKELEIMNERLRELDRLKSHFFTNISHEFRTPLTVISGMADQVKENPEQWFSKGLRMIKRNSMGLLNLVDQILDLAKLESGKLKLNLVQGDVIQFLKYITESFHSLAESKDIQLDFQSSEPELIMDFDQERLLRVVSNLLSNAIKFTPGGGRVKLAVGSRQYSLNRGQSAVSSGLPTENCLQLTVTDTGIGIPSDHLPKIFDRFYQVPSSPPRPPRRGGVSPLPAFPEGGGVRTPGFSPPSGGAGIGLALTRELVQLMEGDIRVESEEGGGTTFQVALPIRRSAELIAVDGQDMQGTVLNGQDHLLREQGQPIVKQDQSITEQDRSTLLIVEDNPDIVEYLRSCLESQYELLIAHDGQEGVDRAIEEVPDLIISDVMMPRKDGFELCLTLKTDERTSHIPIVLLTAKADQTSKVEGLMKGADAYLSKPFDKEELFVRLEQLLVLRRKLQERYQNLEGITPSEDEGIRQEDAFLIKVRDQVEENIDDENMSISGLARAVGVSRTQLHNKVKALTGRSPSVFVRTIRLYKARELLKTSELNISQIAFEVGFRDPAYFSRTFSEEFGLSPKEMRS